MVALLVVPRISREVGILHLFEAAAGLEQAENNIFQLLT